MSKEDTPKGSLVPAAEEHRPKPGLFTRFLWYCAGADSSLLKHCPVSDWVKYQGIGGIVLATTVLAFVSASYAFYTVFSPKTDTALAVGIDMQTAVFSGIAGFIWSLVIFNIDRFIVSSTGKGDGSEKISWDEFQQALPRLFMAIIIGVCISAPLEIRILKPEIDAQLELEQNEYLAELNQHSEGLIQDRKDELSNKIDKVQGGLDERREYFEKRRLEIAKQRRLLELEADGKTAARRPAARKKAPKAKAESAESLADQARDRVAHTLGHQLLVEVRARAVVQLVHRRRAQQRLGAGDQVQQLLAHGTKLLLQLSLVGHHLCCLLLNMFKQRNTPCSTSVTSRLYRLLFALPLGTHRLLRLGKAIENTPRGTLGANNVLERNTASSVHHVAQRGEHGSFVPWVILDGLRELGAELWGVQRLCLRDQVPWVGGVQQTHHGTKCPG